MSITLNTSLPFSGQSLAGQKYGRWSVLEYTGKVRRRSGKFEHYWKCQCECGEIQNVTRSNLKFGRTKSCGCYNRDALSKRSTTHGYTAQRKIHPLYVTWGRIVDRSENKNNKRWLDYGGRGIKMCQRWRRQPAEFIADMLPSFKQGLSVDRTNNDGHYSCGKCDECKRNGWPMNCRWATRFEQTNNQRRNRVITFNGLTLTIAQWGRKLHLDSGVIRSRLDRGGWTLERALTECPHSNA